MKTAGIGVSRCDWILATRAAPPQGVVGGHHVHDDGVGWGGLHRLVEPLQFPEGGDLEPEAAELGGQGHALEGIGLAQVDELLLPAAGVFGRAHQLQRLDLRFRGGLEVRRLGLDLRQFPLHLDDESLARDSLPLQQLLGQLFPGSGGGAQPAEPEGGAPPPQGMDGAVQRLDGITLKIAYGRNPHRSQSFFGCLADAPDF